MGLLAFNPLVEKTIDLLPNMAACRVRQTLRRLVVGLRFIFGRTQPDDAYMLITTGEEASGCFYLESIEVQDIIENALDVYEPHPELENLAWRAARRVNHKWMSTGDVRYAALDWAASLIPEYAAEKGIVLVKKAEEDADAADDDADED
jgi:hypothetical protein